MCFLATLCLIGAFIATFVVKLMKYEDTWYVGRAVAESTKTRAWRFMMAAPPYPVLDPDGQSRKQFIDDMKEITGERGDVTFSISLDPKLPEISDEMTKLRHSSLADRLAAYIECRVADQRTWYAKKSKMSIAAESKAFGWMCGAQIAAIVVSLYAIYDNQPTSGSVGVLASVSAAVLAWMQVKKYQETGKAYEIASEELGFAESLAKDISTEDQLSDFVIDTESAISREHTLCVARRGGAPRQARSL